jgi:Rrf2 family protein
MLSKKTKYAINALVYMARHIEEQPISAHTISKDQNIPLKFLESILTELKNARILKSKKGKNGGYTLNELPEQIHMAKVMRLFDGAIAILPCVSLNFYERCEECKDEATCGIRQVALEIRDLSLQVLTNATLKDILNRESILKQ